MDHFTEIANKFRLENPYNPEDKRWENVTPKQYREALESSLRNLKQKMQDSYEAERLAFESKFAPARGRRIVMPFLGMKFSCGIRGLVHTGEWVRSLEETGPFPGLKALITNANKGTYLDHWAWSEAGWERAYAEGKIKIL